jgi:hypothetical protein
MYQAVTSSKGWEYLLDLKKSQVFNDISMSTKEGRLNSIIYPPQSHL